MIILHVRYGAVIVRCSDVVLEARPWPQDALRPILMALAMTSRPMALALNVHALALVVRAKLTK